MNKSSDTITVLIADDHPIFRDGLKLLLENLVTQGVFLIGEASSGQAVLLHLEEVEPDIILMDIQMPELNGIEATALIKTRFPAIKVVALSSFADLWSVADMMAAGASGYLLKNTGKEELLLCIKKVYAGGQYLTPAVEAHLETIRETHIGEKELTPREKEVVQLLCEGKTNKEIASAMQISKRTVEGHRVNIMVKVNARHTADIITYAVKHGIHKV